MKAIVGSAALKHFNVARRHVKDIDLWHSSDEIIHPGYDSMIMPDDIFELLDIQEGYCTPNTIYTIKCSHFGWDIHWEKTKSDILWLISKGCYLKPELYFKLLEHWKKTNNNKEFLSLSKDKREFFNDHVTYVYDHDYLHEVVAYPNEPMYKRCLKESQEVLLDKNKFDQLSFENKVRMFREEISTIAIERWLVNPKWQGSFTISQAYSLALKKTIVSLTKNWATDFIVTNLDKFYKVDLSYFKRADELGINKMGSLEILSEFMKSYEELVGHSLNLYHLATGNFYGEEAQKWCEENAYELLEQEGGGEGGSEWCHSVFKLKNKTIKLNYNYYSHQGFDFDDATAKEVKSIKKTITVYE